ncbi:pyridoxal phosphate-dependent aminotransferase [Francisellaceae bacterium]|nr:pyridoxal phosphate-dependent aminotransferase [Francisellaceae bacterium]
MASISKMKNRVSQRINNIKPSPTMEITRLAKNLIDQGEDVIALSAGEASFESPASSALAGIKAVTRGKTRYTQVDGIPELKKQIAKRYSRDYQLDFSIEEIMVTTGAKHALFNAFNVLINHGDEVIIPAPFWVSYPDMVKLCDGIPVIVESKKAGLFKLTAEALEQNITPQTKVVILNSPNNPTGVIYSAEDLTEIANVLRKHPNIFIFSDEIYDLIYWNEQPAHILQVAPDLKDRCIIQNGISKSYAMAGWRVGYSIAPSDITKAMRVFQSQSLSNPCSISQYAAVDALSIPREQLLPQIEAYQQRVKYVCDRINQLHGFNVTMPSGAFYLFVDMQKYLAQSQYASDEEFVLAFLDKQKVAVIHGSAFGVEGHFRISCAASLEQLTEAMNRLEAFINE